MHHMIFFQMIVNILFMDFHSFDIGRDDNMDVLAVGDWNKKLSFYQLSGKQVYCISFSNSHFGISDVCAFV